MCLSYICDYLRGRKKEQGQAGWLTDMIVLSCIIICQSLPKIKYMFSLYHFRSIFKLCPPFFFLYVFYNKLLWVARSLSYADIINSFFMADIDIFLWVCGVGPPDFGP